MCLSKYYSAGLKRGGRILKSVKEPSKWARNNSITNVKEYRVLFLEVKRGDTRIWSKHQGEKHVRPQRGEERATEAQSEDPGYRVLRDLKSVAIWGGGNEV